MLITSDSFSKRFILRRLHKFVDISNHEVCIFWYNPSPGVSRTIRRIVAYTCWDCSICGSTIRHLRHIQAMDYSKFTIPFLFVRFLVPYFATYLTVSLEMIFLQSWNHRHYPNSGPGNTEDGLSSFQLFLCGLAAGTCAKLVCHPLDVVKKRFQVRIFALCWMRFVNLAIYDLRLKID